MHVFVAVAVSTVHLQPEPGIGSVQLVFDGECEQPGSAQRTRSSLTERPQIAEVHKGVCRDDHVERIALGCDELGELGLNQIRV